MDIVIVTQVVDVVPDVQNVALVGTSGDDVELSFLGQNITVTIGTDTPAAIQASLEALLTVRESMDHARYNRIPRLPHDMVSVEGS